MNTYFRRLPIFFIVVLLIPLLFMALNPTAAASNETVPPLRDGRIPPHLDTFPPRLRVSEAEKPVRLVSLAVRTEIRSAIAESSLEMEFYNPNNRILEGELEFPLLPGQEISGLALDIDGTLHRGVPVSKTRGQEVFDEVVRQQVDPALLESTRGNAYRLRVYPLPAKGKRRVVVRIMQPLHAENGVLRYRLPLSYADSLDTISVEALVVSPGGNVKAEAGNLGLQLLQTGKLFSGKAERRNLTPEGWLDISLPAMESLAEAVTAVRWKDKLYFSTAAHIPLPEKKRTLPDRVTVLWDASGSGLQRDHAREFALLDRYFQAFGAGEARLIVLRDKVEAPQNFPVRNGDWGELKTALQALVYDGATNLADWTPSSDCREYLLFSDGVSNYRSGSGNGAFPRMEPDQRLFAVNAAPAADYTALRGLAVRGAISDLAHESFEQAIAKLLQEGTQVCVLSALLAGAGEAALAPDSGYLTTAKGHNGFIRLAGWVKRGSDAKSVTVRVIHPDASSTDMVVSLPAWENLTESVDGEAPLEARLWGRYGIAGLETDRMVNKKAIARLGNEFGIVSRETSLIVLETAEEYARYGVHPPASLQAKVEALGRHRRDLGGERRLSDDDLFALWNKKVTWWNTSFPQKSEAKKAKGEPAPEELRHFSPAAPMTEADNPFLTPSPRPAPNPLQSAKRAQGPPLPAGVPQMESREFRMERPKSVEPSRERSVGIQLRPWVSDAPYIARMRAAKDAELYAVYLDERPAYMNSSAFFLDVADRFFERGMKELGLRVLSNLAEMQLENRQVLRMLAYRLMQAGETALALPVLENVRELAPYEPQSLRDIATAHAALGNVQEAVDLLYETARRVWSDRFGEINTIALTEMNALIATSGTKVKTDAIDPRLVNNLSSDIRVVLSWDMDNTDMDLWVRSPDGEAASYKNRLTRLGGRMSRDCTQGYGPEEFMLKKAAPGVYRVEVDYYGHSRQTIAGEVTMLVTVFSKFGAPMQKAEHTTLRLKNAKDRVLIAQFTVKEP